MSSLKVLVPATRLAARSIPTAAAVASTSRRYLHQQAEQPVFGKKEKAHEDQYVRHHEQEQLSALHDALEHHTAPSPANPAAENATLAQENYTYASHLKRTLKESLNTPLRDLEPFRFLDATFYKRVTVYP